VPYGLVAKEDLIKRLFLFCLVCLFLLSACNTNQADIPEILNNAPNRFPIPAIEYQPRHYVCYQTTDKLKIDGRLSEAAWQTAPWTEAFVDIEGEAKPLPRFATHARMLWDSTYFYIAARMEEPHLWGTLTERDAVIYHDNDFEVFIDPNGDSHEYYELEINALGTEWDLLLVKPYRDGAPAVNAWDIQGLKSAVALDGTLNKPHDIDSGWSVEIAIPWKVLAECAHRPSPPHNGDTWWVNFSRVQWHLNVIDDSYTKQMDSTGERPLPENNWVWSPQGLIAMHYPEMWGLVQFSSIPVGERQVNFEPPDDLSARWALWQLYYAEREYEAVHGKFTDSLRELILPDSPPSGYNWPPSLFATNKSFIATITRSDGRKSLTIGTNGRLISVETVDEDR